MSVFNEQSTRITPLSYQHKTHMCTFSERTEMLYFHVLINNSDGDLEGDHTAELTGVNIIVVFLIMNPKILSIGCISNLQYKSKHICILSFEHFYDICRTRGTFPVGSTVQLNNRLCDLWSSKTIPPV